MSEYTKGPWEARKGAGWFIARTDAMRRRDLMATNKAEGKL